MSEKLLAGVRTVPMILVMAAIFMLSAQPGGTLYLPPIPEIDKVAHAVVYGALAAATIFAFNTRYKEEKSRVVVMATTIFCFCYGVSDELHQYFVPGRSTSGLDVLADVCGALLTCLLWAGLRKKLQHRTATTSR